MHARDAFPDRPIRSGVLLAGTTVAGGGEPLDAVDPATGSGIGVVETASSQQVAEAVSSGRRAMRDRSWTALPAPDRAALLLRIATLIDDHGESLAALQTVQNGKPITESRSQARSAAETFRYYAGLCETLEGGLPPPRGNHLGLTVHEPVGVVAAITPWNSPLTMAAQKVAPALAAGNAVVLKPAEQSAFVITELGRLCCEAGLPPGLLSVLPGTADTGRQLVANRGIGLISFTGGTATGRSIAAAAGQRLIPALMELGGKSPHIVFPDADMDRAAAAVASGIFGGAGQSCVAGSRLFVHESIAAAFRQRLLEVTAGLTVGIPTSAETQVGPLVSTGHRAVVEAFVDLAVAEGGRILAGGSRPAAAEFANGSYFLPTVIDGLDNSARAVREEIFGPVLAILTFRDEDDLVEQANDSDYGLACGIWTADYRRAWRIARAIDAGTVWINSYKILSIANPFGGFHASGLGREKGIEGLRSYQASKSIFFGLD